MKRRRSKEKGGERMEEVERIFTKLQPRPEGSF